MNQETVVENLIRFRDDLKEYHQTCMDMWKARDSYDSVRIEEIKETREKPQREKLTEDFGYIEKYLNRLGVSMAATAYGSTFLIFDAALSSTVFENPAKGEGLPMAVQMATKAIGIAKSMSESEMSKINRNIPNIFISYNFSEENKTIAKKIIDFVGKFDVAIILGSETDNKSISEKVKEKIDNADIVVAVMTKDEQNASGEWSPSKWIIEEMAYALASKKEIIRLLEDGNAKDGRIFGDKEYIPFNRDDMSDALVRLAEVLIKKLR